MTPLKLVAFHRPATSTTEYGRVLDKLRWVRVHAPSHGIVTEYALDCVIDTIAAAQGITRPAFIPTPLPPSLPQDAREDFHRSVAASYTTLNGPTEDTDDSPRPPPPLVTMYDENPDLQRLVESWVLMPPDMRQILLFTAWMVSLSPMDHAAFTDRAQLPDDANADTWMSTVGEILRSLAVHALDAFTLTTNPEPAAFRANRRSLARVLMGLATHRDFDDTPAPTTRRRTRAAATEHGGPR